MRAAAPPITAVDTSARSTAQGGVQLVSDQEWATKAKTIAKSETTKNATKSPRGGLIKCMSGDARLGKEGTDGPIQRRVDSSGREG